jgi:type I restriction enzyme S subunit
MKGGARSEGIISLGGEHLRPDGNVDYSVPRYVSQEFYAEMKTGRIELHDCLMVKDGATTGKTAFVDHVPDNGMAAINEHVFLVRSFGPLDKNLVYLFVRALVAHFVLHQSSGIIGGIKREVLLDFPFPLPPLSEQRRIVSKVDGLMSLCDELESRGSERVRLRDRASRSCLDRLVSSRTRRDLSSAWQRLSDHFEVLYDTPETLAHLRQSILQLAVQGKLVPQDPNDEPIERVVESILEDKSSSNGKRRSRRAKLVETDAVPFELPSSWVWAKLGDLLEPERDISYGVIKLGSEPKTGGVTTLRCSDVLYRTIRTDRARKITEELSNEYSRTILRGGEILMNIRGTLGGCGIVPPECKGFNIAREVAVIPISKRLNTRFILDVISSPHIQDATQESLRGIAYKGLNLGLLREFAIPLPPLAEQKRIVAKVDQLLSQCDELSARLRERQSATQQLLTATIQYLLEKI